MGVFGRNNMSSTSLVTSHVVTCPRKQPWPTETLSPTFPPAPVIALVPRWNFHKPDPSRLHGKSIEFVTLSPNFFILMFFSAGTFFMVLDRLSHTHTYIYKLNPHSLFLHTDTAGPWFWPLILHLFPAARIAGFHFKNTWHKFWNRKRASKEHVKFTISKANASPSPRETLSPTFPPAPVIVLVQRWNFHNPDPSRLHWGWS